jgi:hypothetical protein
MQTTVVRTCSTVINRPIEEVRAQFSDMRYHVAQNVHPDLTFTLHESTPTTCRFSQKITLAGMPQIDEILNTVLPNGDLRSDFVGGMNTGGTLTVTFKQQSPGSTMVGAELRIPLIGMKTVIAPILGAAAQRALERGFAQDKKDLEAGNYARYRARQYAST